MHQTSLSRPSGVLLVVRHETPPAAQATLALIRARGGANTPSLFVQMESAGARDGPWAYASVPGISPRCGIVLAVSDAIEVHDVIEPARLGQLLEFYRATWWAAHRTQSDVERMLAGSDLVIALVDEATDRLVAFARVLTDFVYRAAVFDVIVA